MKRDGTPASVLYHVNVQAYTDYEWETDDRPTGYNYGNDTIHYSKVQYAVINEPIVSSVSFSDDFEIDSDMVSIRDAPRVLDPNALRQLLNPELYSNMLRKSFESTADLLEPPERDDDPPERDDDPPERDYYD